MRRVVLLLRGINVGGKNILPMKELRDLLTLLGAKNITSYIQSGNVVLQTSAALPALAKKLSSAIEQEYGFNPTVTVLGGEEFEQIVSANPFVGTASERKHLHTWFLAQSANSADVEALENLVSNGEQFVLSERAFYLHAPAGIGRSKLAANVEKLLGVSCTARNENTLQKLMQGLHALT